MRSKEEDRALRNIAQNKKRAENREKYNEYSRNLREKNKERINSNKRKPEVRKKLNEFVKSWRKRNADRFKNTERIKREKNKEKYYARNLVYKWISRGKMIRPNHCERCKIECKPEAHHDDYFRPSEIQWLCRVCHLHTHGKAP